MISAPSVHDALFSADRETRSRLGLHRYGARVQVCGARLPESVSGNLQGNGVDVQSVALIPYSKAGPARNQVVLFLLALNAQKDSRSCTDERGHSLGLAVGMPAEQSLPRGLKLRSEVRT